MKTMKVEDFVRLHPDEFPSLAKFFGVKQRKQQMSVEDYNYTLDDLRDKFDAPYSKPATPVTTYGKRITVAQFDYTTKPNTIKLLRTDNGYKQTTELDDKQAMHKQAWYVMHSPKLLALTIKTSFYSKDIASMISYAEMIGITIDIITPSGKLHSSREFLVWYQEQQTAQEEYVVSIENVKLMVEHAPELLPYAKKSCDKLRQVLTEQISKANYDADMQSYITTDGLNSGRMDDNKGIREWSRTYTKHYERYDHTLRDLILTYISCKFYAAHDMEHRSDGINRDDVDSYTGASLTTTTTADFIRRARMITMSKMVDPNTYSGIDFIPSLATLDALEEDADLHCMIWNLSVDEPSIPEREDIVVPVSACSLSVQNQMN